MLALAFDPDTLTCDLALGPGGLVQDNGLTSVVLASLLTDARAEPADPLPAGVTDRRGWVGDVIAVLPNDRFGSKLWLLSREKQTEQTRRRAETYARDALAWLIADGAAQSVTVVAAWLRAGVLGLTVRVTPKAGAVVVVQTTVPLGGDGASASAALAPAKAVMVA
jgi:phage gp46-like protein